MKSLIQVIFAAGFLSLHCATAAEPNPFRAGVAVKVITPAEPMWMSGYAARNKPAEGKVHDLYVKALALEDNDGKKLVLMTSDLCGIPRDLSDAVCRQISSKCGLKQDQFMLTVSHTHCGPVVSGNLSDMYDMPPEHMEKVRRYTELLKGWMVEAIEAALADLKPCRLEIGKGTAKFAVNRRPQGGPVDHDVPVMRVLGDDGHLRAVVFGYACHNTTLQFYRWCGDYAGMAQAQIEEKHPGAKAFFWSGCGADANPLPRGTLELCEKYGRELTQAVESVCSRPMTALKGSFANSYSLLELPFDKLPTKQMLNGDLAGKNFAARQRAKHLLHELNTRGKIDEGYKHYPVQVWRIGDDLLWVALGGEVVADYSLRLKKELQGKRAVWVAGYANDVMAYIPSERVLREGGYEGDTSMIYYGLPAKWASGVENLIVDRARMTADRLNPR